MYMWYVEYQVNLADSLVAKNLSRFSANEFISFKIVNGYGPKQSKIASNYMNFY